MSTREDMKAVATCVVGVSAVVAATARHFNHDDVAATADKVAQIGAAIMLGLDLVDKVGEVTVEVTQTAGAANVTVKHLALQV